MTKYPCLHVHVIPKTLTQSSVPDRRSVRVVVLSDTVTDDCLDVKHPIDAFTIASKNRVAEGYRKVAKWICVDESKGGSHGGPSGDVTSRSSNSDARQSSSSSKSSTTQSSSSSTPPTTSSTSSSTSRSTPSENKQAQMPYVPGAGTDVALLFVIDFTKSSEKLFNAVIDYVVRISDYVPKARIGIVMISCPSKTLLEIGIYSGPEIRSNVIAPTEPLKEKGTAQALEIGKKLLESVNRKHKFVFLMSDGGKSTCLKEKPKEDEIKIAEIIRNLGIKILYSIVGDNPDKDTIDKITGDSKLCINLGDLI
ncbi:von Willebrand factor type A domain protein, partial [Teladorsagia circumcincta]